ncbi:MAG TPA: HAMP domain-containing sensor histidine kinase [Pirellulales bacterium]|jgi:signal transduction histidine kinase
MNSKSPKLRLADPAEVAVDSDLQTVLNAWHDATIRWEQTHETLQAEVRRLSTQLAAKQPMLIRGDDPTHAGRIAAQLAIGIRDKLVPASLHLNLLRRRVLDDAVALDLLQKADQSFVDADSLVENLMQFVVERHPHLQPINLRALVCEVHAELLPTLCVQGVATTIDVPEHVSVEADSAMLRRALTNLTRNALDAMPGGGELVVTSYVGHHCVELEIADSGVGLADEAKERAFEPLYTTKSNRAGLGLAIVQSIAEAHGGDVFAANCPDGGAAFTIRLPRRALAAAA